MPGLYFEEFTIGQKFDHSLHRTITESDNVWFSALTHNPQPLHLDAEFCKRTEFGRPIVNSCLTLGFMVGISVADTTVGTTVANLGWDEVRFPKPLFHGDTIRVETEVLQRNLGDPTVMLHITKVDRVTALNLVAASAGCRLNVVPAPAGGADILFIRRLDD